MTPDLDSPMFNLIDEPWIPCIRNTGEKVELSLREALLGAHELRGIYGESPLVIASIYRLLLAMLYSIYGNPSTSSWRKLWQAASNDAEQVNAYLNKWHERFYLFHPERPFYQWGDELVSLKSVDNILHENASGNNSTLFDHSSKNTEKKLSPSEAIRVLLSAQAYGIAGPCNPKLKLYFSNSPWTSGAIFLLKGETLFETLVLNWFQPPQEMRNHAQPFWESDDPYLGNREVPNGYLDYLTWPSRKILLLPTKAKTGDVEIRKVTESPGLTLMAKILDPMKHYGKNSQDGYSSTKFGEAKALWRNSASLLELTKQDEIKAPQVLHWTANLVADGYLPENSYFKLTAMGMAAGRLDMEINASAGKVHFYRHEEFDFPATYLQKQELVRLLEENIEASKNTQNKLYGALNKMATLKLAPTAYDDEGHPPDLKDVKNLINHWAADRQYWVALETPFFQLLRDLLEEGEAAIHRWDTALQEAARAAFDHAAEMAGNDARALRASVKAQGQLHYSLKQLFSPQ